MKTDAVKQLFDKLKKDKKALFIVVIGAVGMLLIMFSELIASGDKDIPKQSGTSPYIYSESELAEKLENLIENIDGAGKAKVMLTYECTEETVFAADKDERVRADGETQTDLRYIIIDEGDGENGLKTKIISPKVSGVAVVCQGGDNPVIKEQIVSAVSALFDISSRKISVAAMAK